MKTEHGKNDVILVEMEDCDSFLASDPAAIYPTMVYLHGGNGNVDQLDGMRIWEIEWVDSNGWDFLGKARAISAKVYNPDIEGVKL